MIEEFTMKRVYVADSVPMAWHISNVLEQYGIEALIKNDRLYSVAGEVPVNECLPEVWVKNDLDYSRAERILRELESSPKAEEKEWVCGACGEENGGNFDLCWNCQHARTAVGEAG